MFTKRTFINKTIGLFILSLLFPTYLIAQTKTQIPVQILNKTIQISTDMTRAEAQTTLAQIIKEEPSVNTDERLQYDVQLVPNNAPVGIFFDFDKQGTVNSFTLDSFEKAQNPAAATLVTWLQTHVGKPNIKNGNMSWRFGGWNIELTEGGSGEDSIYRITLTQLKTKNA